MGRRAVKRGDASRDAERAPDTARRDIPHVLARCIPCASPPCGSCVLARLRRLQPNFTPLDVAQEVGEEEGEYEDEAGGHVEYEEHEELVVRETDAAVRPRAEVVHLQHAPVELPAKVRAVRLVDGRVALSADATGAVVFRLKRRQGTRRPYRTLARAGWRRAVS